MREAQDGRVLLREVCNLVLTGALTVLVLAMFHTRTGPEAAPAVVRPPAVVGAVAAPPVTVTPGPARRPPGRSADEVVERFLQTPAPNLASQQALPERLLNDLLSRPGSLFKRQQVRATHVDGPQWRVLVELHDARGGVAASALCDFNEESGFPPRGCVSLSFLAAATERFDPGAVSEAQKLVPFPARQPAYLPQRSRLQEISVVNAEGRRDGPPRLRFTYIVDGSSMLILEERTPDDLVDLSGVPSGVRDVDISGATGKLWEGIGGSMFISWQRDGQVYVLGSPTSFVSGLAAVDELTLLRIARSVP